ncbi:MAG: SDR family NAD(P)-dependent oxidoreductase [Hyphomicrobiales bacterium]
MTGLFAGKRVLVTGSTRGLGLATARRFLEEGAEIIVHGRSRAPVERVVASLLAAHPGRVSGEAAALSDRLETDRLANAAGDLDVLVNSAGVFEEVMMANADPEHWLRTIEINLTAPWRLARALLDGLARREGVIVNVGSDAAFVGYAGSVAYCASKGALVGLTKALAVELAPKVRAVCVCPGPIETDMMRESVAAQPDPVAAVNVWESNPMLKRVAQPEEIAEAVLFAASPRCRYQTGSVVMVDGGVTAGRRVP